MKDKDSQLIWESFTEDFEFGGHTGEQRRTSAEQQAYVISDSQGVYGVYTTMEGAADALKEFNSRGSYVTAVSVDVTPRGPQEW